MNLGRSLEDDAWLQITPFQLAGGVGICNDSM